MKKTELDVCVLHSDTLALEISKLARLNCVGSITNLEHLYSRCGYSAGLNYRQLEFWHFGFEAKLPLEQQEKQLKQEQRNSFKQQQQKPTQTATK